MSVHQLCILGFYTYIVKYLVYRQLRVPSILAALAQSVHDLTPPDAVIPVIRKLAQEFIHPGVGSEVVAAGLNAIREICRRQPWSIEEDLLGDLVEYRKSRDKAVAAAARGLLQLYREVNPGMLKRRERVSAVSGAIDRSDILKGKRCKYETGQRCPSSAVWSSLRGRRRYRGPCREFLAVVL
jgi:protein SDA1